MIIGSKWPVNNIVEIPMDAKWYDNNFKSSIPMNSTTYGTIIVPSIQGWLIVQANI